MDAALHDAAAHEQVDVAVESGGEQHVETLFPRRQASQHVPDVANEAEIEHAVGLDPGAHSVWVQQAASPLEEAADAAMDIAEQMAELARVKAFQPESHFSPFAKVHSPQI